VIVRKIVFKRRLKISKEGFERTDFVTMTENISLRKIIC
jgi:hypothetical protein